MAKNDNTTPLLVLAGLGLVYFVTRPKTTKPTVTSITPSSGATASTNAPNSNNNLLSSFTNLIPSISNLFNPGSAPNPNNQLAPAILDNNVTVTNSDLTSNSNNDLTVYDPVLSNTTTTDQFSNLTDLTTLPSDPTNFYS